MTLDEMEFRIRGPQGAAASFIDTSGLGAAPNRTIKDLSKPLGLGRVGGNIGDILSAQALGSETLNRLAEERVKLNESLRLSMEGIIAKEKELIGTTRTSLQAASERAMLNQRTSQSLADIATAEGELSDAARAGVNVTAEREALARRRSQVLKDASQQEAALLQLERAGVNVAKERAALDAQRATLQKNYAARQGEIDAAEAAAARTAMLGRAAGALGAAYMIGAVGRSVSETSQAISVAGALDGPGAAFQKARESTPGQFVETLSYATPIPYVVNPIRSALNGGEDPAVTAERERRKQDREKAIAQQREAADAAALRASSMRSGNDAAKAGGFEGERIRAQAEAESSKASIEIVKRRAEEENKAERQRFQDRGATNEELAALDAEHNRQQKALADQLVEIERSKQLKLKEIQEREIKDRDERNRRIGERIVNVGESRALGQAGDIRRTTGDEDRAARVEIEARRKADQERNRIDMQRKLSEAKNAEERVSIMAEAGQQSIDIERKANDELRKLADEKKAQHDREIAELQRRKRAIEDIRKDTAESAIAAEIAQRRRAGDIAGADRAQSELDQRQAERQANAEAEQGLARGFLNGGLAGALEASKQRGNRQAQIEAERAARDEQIARDKKRRDEERSLDIARQAQSMDERRLAMQAQAGDKNAERMLEEISILRRYEDQARDINRRLEDDKELTAEQRKELERQRDALGGLAREEVNAARGRREVDFLRNRTPFATTDTQAYLTTRSNDVADELARETRRAEMELQKKQSENVDAINKWLQNTLPGLLGGGSFDIGANSVFG